MSRSKIMTIGFLLVMIGVQLNMVDTYTLTSKATRFLKSSLAQLDDVNPGQNYSTYNSSYTSPYYQASYPNSSYMPQQLNVPGKQLTPSTWYCWPVMFMGVVMVLHGVALKN